MGDGLAGSQAVDAAYVVLAVDTPLRAVSFTHSRRAPRSRDRRLDLGPAAKVMRYGDGSGASGSHGVHRERSALWRRVGIDHCTPATGSAPHHHRISRATRPCLTTPRASRRRAVDQVPEGVAAAPTAPPRWPGSTSRTPGRLCGHRPAAPWFWPALRRGTPRIASPARKPRFWPVHGKRRPFGPPCRASSWPSAVGETSARDDSGSSPTPPPQHGPVRGVRRECCAQPIHRLATSCPVARTRFDQTRSMRVLVRAKTSFARHASGHSRERPRESREWKPC
jgi:hypothetical protein